MSSASAISTSFQNQQFVTTSVVKPVSIKASRRKLRAERRKQQEWQRPERDVESLEESLKQLSLNGKVTLKGPSPVASFKDMGLNPDVLNAISKYKPTKLEKPSLCQQNVIIPIIQGRDVICQAQSGMGKTAAFVIGIFQRIDRSNKNCQALVLAPTRELALQIREVFQQMGNRIGIRTVGVIGQHSRVRINKDKLRNGAHVVVATPGRLQHFLRDEEDPLNSKGIKMFVIDEADKLISDGSFHEDMKTILTKIPGDAQMIVMSATMPSYALEKFNSIMYKPIKFLVKNDQLTLDGIRQYHINVGAEQYKFDTLMELFPYLNKKRGITFCNTRARAESVSKKMHSHGQAMEGMIGTMEQSKRENTLGQFRTGKLLSIVATDLLGRGVDVDHVKLVVNYDIPEYNHNVDYIHRVGRAGRYGKRGIAITFVTDGQMGLLKNLEEFYHTKIPPMPRNIADLMEEMD